MLFNKQVPFGLLLLLLTTAACSNSGSEVERRSVSKAAVSTKVDAPSNTANATPDSTGDTSYGTIDPNFNPEDPNTFARKPGVNFPELAFTVTDVPTGPSDHYNFNLTVKADASISHYAYKLDSSKSCDKTGGYTVAEAKNPIAASLDKLPMGPIFLCVIAFHFPTKQWQDITKALSFNWQKVAFKRTIDSYYEFVDTQCKSTARITAKLTIEGDKGSYTWKRVAAQGCQSDQTTYSDAMSLIQVTEKDLQGAWHEGAVVAGWFKFTWTNAERTAFKGTWGYGEPGVKTEGVWNSAGN